MLSPTRWRQRRAVPRPAPADRTWTGGATQAFDVHEPAGGPRLPLLVHVPHAGTAIPDDVRAGVVLDDAELSAEVLALTDWHTDQLAVEPALATGGVALANRMSRLVVDVERLPDHREPMAAKGLAAVYTHTSAGAVLRRPSPALRRALLARYFHPWLDTAERLVADLLVEHQRCLVVDVHSFPARPLPYEDAARTRPDVCLGFEEPHVPAGLVDALEATCRDAGLTVARNEPFAGAYVPLSRHRRDARVRAVMLELNRGLYLDEATAAPGDGFAPTADLVAALIAQCAEWVEATAR